MKEFIEQLEHLNAVAPSDVPEPGADETALAGPESNGADEGSTHDLRLADADELSSAWRPDAQELGLFSRTGLHLHDPGQLRASHRGFWPAFLHAYRSLGRYRKPWPVFMETSERGVHVCSLPTWIDDLSDEVTSNEQKGRLEAHLRAVSASRSVTEWDVVQGGAPDDLAVPDPALQAAWLLAPTPDAMSMMWGQVNAAVNAGRRKSFVEELHVLRSRLADLVRVEEGDGQDAHDPDTLRHSMGGAFADTIDFGSLAHLMDEAPHAAPSDTNRLERIRSIMEDLTSIPVELYDGEVLSTPRRSTSDALELLHAQVERFTRLSRAVQIARLEVENRYRPELHDQVFENFSYQAIPASERKAFPPVTVHLTLHGDDDPEPLLLGLREPGMLRVLLTSTDVFNERAEHHPIVDAARRLVADADTFVQQTTVSHVDFLLEGFTLAARSQGNAVVSVAIGAGADPVSEESYLSAAVLSESRVFPCFRFDPENGTEWADWMDVDANESPAAAWVEHALESSDEAVPDCFALTPADLLFLDGRFADQFHLLHPDVDSPDLIDVGEWTRLDASRQPSRIPFIWLSKPEGSLARCVVSPMIMRAVSLSARRWHLLQEWSGMDSSLVRRQLEAAQSELESERDRAIESARQDFESRMEANTETLARQIVEKIAASLLDGGAPLSLGDSDSRTRLAAQASRIATPVKTEPDTIPEPEADTQAEPEPEPEETPALSLDEAYIDTPLCTSCNECTDRNGLIFAYDDNKQAYIKDAGAGPFRDIVMAAEKCPVRIIHPGKPLDPDEGDLDEWIERAQPYQ